MFFLSLLQNGKWNGLMAELVAKKFDMVLTSLKVNSEREAAVDFTAPFLESGTTILVAKRTGIISPTAFLEPFDAASWLLVIIVAVNIAAFTIFFYEWLSPAGYNMKVRRQSQEMSATVGGLFGEGSLVAKENSWSII